MTTPFDMIGQKELAPTCTAIADAGGTTEHAAWIRRPRNAAKLVAFINDQMSRVNTPLDELFESERGTSTYAPPKDWVPKAHEMQHGSLRELWSSLEAPPSIEALLQPYMTPGEAKSRCENNTPSIVLPDGEEGFFFGAKLSSIARVVKGNKGLPDYYRVFKYLFGMLRERQPNFKDWNNGKIGEKYEKPIEAWWKRRMAYEATIQGDFAAYAGQTGIAYRNWSVRAARAHMEQGQRRVGMTSLDAAQILLFHEERLTKPEHLAMDCAGTERAHNGRDFHNSSFFDFRDGMLSFYLSDVRGRYPGSGSASFCLPGVAQPSLP